MQLDEMMVTQQTFPRHEWSSKGTNISLDLSKTPTAAVAVVAAVSRERGIELLMCFPKSINQVKFKVFLEELRRINLFEDMLLVMDNLMVHKCKHMQERLDELGFEVAWTPPYSPQFNGIEEVWSMAKQKIKAERLRRVQMGEKINLQQIIKTAFSSLS